MGWMILLNKAFWVMKKEIMIAHDIRFVFDSLINSADVRYFKNALY